MFCWLMLAGLTCSLHGQSPLEYKGSLFRADGSSSLESVSSVSVDPQTQEICVTDLGSATLHVFNAKLVQEFETSRLSSLSRPMDAAIDAWGGFVLTDGVTESGRTIKRLNYLGEPIPYEPERPSEDWQPGHLLISHDGNYITVDERTDLMVKHDSATGALIWQRKVEDPLPDRQALLGRPVEAPDGRIYVPGGEFGKVFVFSPEGEIQTSFGEQGSGRGKLVFPVGVAIGPGETILVLDRMRHTVLIYDSDHRFVDEYSGFGDRPGGLYHPLSIASLSDGRVCVAQRFRSRVQFFHVEQGLSRSDGAWVISLAEPKEGTG